MTGYYIENINTLQEVPILYDVSNIVNCVKLHLSEILHSRNECLNWFCADAASVGDIATYTHTRTHTHCTPSTLCRFVAWSP